jgi:hypothetical protein
MAAAGTPGFPAGETPRLQTQLVAITSHDGASEAAEAAGAMTLRYAVGVRVGNKADQIAVEAEDALIAALKVKAARPEAAITYVRKQNVRGDRRHPHSSQLDENPSRRATAGAPSADRR